VQPACSRADVALRAPVVQAVPEPRRVRRVHALIMPGTSLPEGAFLE
jgi:hypothetical protein